MMREVGGMQWLLGGEEGLCVWHHMLVMQPHTSSTCKVAQPTHMRLGHPP